MIMTSRSRTRFPHGLRTCASILLVGGLALSGCAAVDKNARSTPSASATKSAVANPRTDATTPAPNPPPSNDAEQPIGDVSLAFKRRGDLGDVLVDGTGATLYAFAMDQQNTPTCYDACARTWLPVLAKGDPNGGHGIDTAAAKTVVRSDGGKQVTYKGHPLYRYAGDQTDQEANGQGLTLFGGQWHVLNPDGEPID
jgi:predicted lipoprotein with Yx(FWY)xxD motif